MRTPTVPLTTVYSIFCLLLPPVLVVSPKAVAPLLLVAALAAAACALLKERRLQLPDGTILAIFGMILLWAGVSCLWSPDVERSLLRFLRVTGLVAAGLVLAGQGLTLDPEQRGRVARWLLIGFAVGLLLLISERLSGGFLHFLGSEPKPGRTILSELNRGATGMAILVWPATLILHRGRLGRWAFALPVVLLPLIGMLESQAASLGLAAGMVLAIAALWRRSLARAVLIATPVLAVVALPLLSGWLYGQQLYDRGLIAYSGEHRLHLWSFLADNIAQKPLLGWGFGGSRLLPFEMAPAFRGTEALVPSHPHNSVLQVWVEMGAVGIALALSLLLILVRRLERMPLGERVSAQALLLSSFVISCIAYGLWQSQWLATLFAAALVVLLSRQSDEPAGAGRDRAQSGAK